MRNSCFLCTVCFLAAALCSSAQVLAQATVDVEVIIPSGFNAPPTIAQDLCTKLNAIITPPWSFRPLQGQHPPKYTGLTVELVDGAGDAWYFGVSIYHDGVNKFTWKPPFITAGEMSQSGKKPGDFGGKIASRFDTEFVRAFKPDLEKDLGQWVPICKIPDPFVSNGGTIITMPLANAHQLIASTFRIESKKGLQDIFVFGDGMHKEVQGGFQVFLNFWQQLGGNQKQQLPETDMPNLKFGRVFLDLLIDVPDTDDAGNAAAIAPH